METQNMFFIPLMRLLWRLNRNSFILAPPNLRSFLNLGWIKNISNAMYFTRFFLALFSWRNFFAWSRHLKELQLKANLIDCPQIWTVARLTYKNRKVLANCLFRNISSVRAIFVRPLHTFLIRFWKNDL